MAKGGTPAMAHIIEGIRDAINLLLSFDKEIYGIIGLSLYVSLASTLISGIVAIPIGIVLGIKSFPVKKAVIRLLYTMMSLPPVIVGLVVFLFISRNGLLGNLRIVYTPTAIIVAQVLLVTPIIMGTVYAGARERGEEHISIASFNDEIKDLTITVNAMSKCYAMTGWRIGYTASHIAIAKAMNSMQSHATSNPNTIAQHASIEGLTGDQSSVEEMRLAFDERRKYMVQRVNEIKGLSCIVPKGAFYIMMNIKQLIGTTIKGITINGSMDFSELLLEHANVAVVPGIAFGVDEFVRLSYANSLENIKEALNRVDAVLNG